MKKSILALGAAVALGGLGFAGAAHAVAYFGPATGTNATGLVLNAGGTGHMLYTPYFNTQASTATLINITNTDTINGKAVKVRFRGAAGSDDLLDFTVLLSPGDVWTGNVQTLENNSALTTTDTSCTLPAIPAAGAPLSAERLPSYLDGDARLAQAREGYIEILNMADIPPKLVKDTTKDNPLYAAIKHSAGVPKDCNATAVQTTLLSTDYGQAAAEDAGLAAPTGQLMGSWALVNQAELAVYSGAMPAVQAVEDPATNPVVNAAANLNFAPQIAAAYAGTAAVNTITADPLYTTTTQSPLWYDVPDMSTPLFGSDPNAQLAAMDILHNSVVNEYVADKDGAVPMVTDWVVSQPTRRYYAAMDYGTKAADAKILLNDGVTDNPYEGGTKSVVNGMPMLCLAGSVGSTDREESSIATGAQFSPGVAKTFCGEVFTLTFGGNGSVLNASVTNSPVDAAGKAGWGRVSLAGGAAVPMVGFSATSAANRAAGGNYGVTLPHRW